jgi:hypothetical protein
LKAKLESSQHISLSSADELPISFVPDAINTVQPAPPLSPTLFEDFSSREPPAAAGANTAVASPAEAEAEAEMCRTRAGPLMLRTSLVVCTDGGGRVHQVRVVGTSARCIAVSCAMCPLPFHCGVSSRRTQWARLALVSKRFVVPKVVCI